MSGHSFIRSIIDEVLEKACTEKRDSNESTPSNQTTSPLTDLSSLSPPGSLVLEISRMDGPLDDNILASLIATPQQSIEMTSSSVVEEPVNYYDDETPVSRGQPMGNGSINPRRLFNATKPDEYGGHQIQ